MSNPVATLLQHLGSAIVSIFKKAGPAVNDVIREGAALGEAAEPIVDAAFPTVAPLYNLVESSVLQAEATGQSVLAATSGGGNTKLAAVIAGIEPIFVAYYEKEYGITPTLAQIETYVNAVVASLNALPAPALTTSQTVGASTITATKHSHKGRLIMGSPTETITITAMPVDRFSRLEVTMGKHVLQMKGNSGEVKEFGADVDYTYDSVTQTLVLTVKHGPHLKNFDDFCTQLKSWVEAQA
jgi:hypothetical protein